MQQAMKLPPEVIDGAFRISLSRFTTPEEVDRLLEAGYTTDEIEDGLYGGLEW